MVLSSLSRISAVRRQHLLVEFSSLAYACPHGVFMSLTPGDPTLWSGVMFIRKGPYSPSILRFQISFPPTYPALPPLITFSTEIFHPLIAPLTTYMYTTDIQDSGTVSASDEERLPPGAFSLRHGFPAWFGRGSKRSADRVKVGNLQTPLKYGRGLESSSSVGSASPSPGQTTSGSRRSNTSEGGRYEASTYDVLRYIRSTFDDERVMDDLPLEAAGNPGAWHAWQTHRIKLGIISVSKDTSDTSKSPASQNSSTSGAPITSRRPGEWNWDGVWEMRVKKGVEASIAEAELYGASAGDDLIRFLKMDAEQIKTIQEEIRRSLQTVETQRKGIV